MQQQPAAKLKALKTSVYVLQDPATGQYISLRSTPPRLAPLHLATMAPATPYCLGKLAQAASRRLGSNTPHELVRVDA